MEKLVQFGPTYSSKTGPPRRGGGGRRSRASGLRSARGALRSEATWSAATGAKRSKAPRAEPPLPSRRGRFLAFVFRRLLLGRLAAFGFHRLAKAVTFAVHLENVTSVRQPVQKCGRHAFALEDLAPVAERQVAGDQQALAFVSVGEYLEQKLGAAATEGEVAELVADQQIGPVEVAQKTVELVLFLSLF